MKYIYFKIFFLFAFYILYASLVPLNVLGSGGVETPLSHLKRSEGGEMGLATPLKSPLV